MSDSVSIDNEISNDLSRKKIDPLLPVVNDDPRSEDKTRIRTKGGGRNSVSFDPKSTLVRPEMRVIVGPKREVLNKPLKHDDVVVVPDFFCEEDNWEIYYKLVEEIREINNVSDADWVSWHEGAHLIAKNYESSPTFKMVQEKISKYFGIENKSVGTRLNWYRDSSDWKPFHHDSAAYNAQRAKNQNITVGVSFGAARELSFLHAESDHRIYFPQTNGMLFSFGRDTNIKWKHGVNALPEEEKDGKGRISIILWGLVTNVIEEKNSPPMVNNRHDFPGRDRGKGGGRDRDRGYDRDRDRDRDRDYGRDRDRGYERDHDRDRDRDYGRDRGHDRDRDGGRDRGYDRARDRNRDDARDRDYGRDRDRGYDRDRDRERNRDDARDRDRAKQPCRDFKNNDCKYGDSCKYLH